VNYTYDNLNRLLSAEETSAKWGNAFSCDEWGSMNGQTWTPGYAATPGTVSRGASDANGNLALPSVTYDVENRPYPPAPTPTGGYCDTPGYTYCYNWDYDPWGKRVSQTFFGSDTQAFIVNQYYFYGIDGKLLSTVQAMVNDPGTNPLYTLSASTNLYFGGTPIVLNGALVATDRLGSVRANGRGETFAYYPYGLERTSTPDGRQKFATYFRDGQVNGTWEDYADQRYYNPYIGSFWSPDPGGMATADAKDPTSWNRYAYAGGDPVNFVDPTGQYRVDCDLDPYDVSCPGQTGGGAGGGGVDPCWGSYFDPAPYPGCYEPGAGAGPVAEPPTLTCAYSGSQTPPGQWIDDGLDANGVHWKEFGDPLALMFTADGRTGAYTFAVVQLINVIGTVQHSSGPPTVGSGVWTIDNLVPGELQQNGGPQATFTDIPGVASSVPRGGKTLSAIIAESFVTTVSVESGGQFVVCPQVSWTATVDWPRGGAPIGQAVVTSPILP
jgi:RHS repeat-associated protein